MSTDPPTRRELIADLTRESIDMGTYDMSAPTPAPTPTPPIPGEPYLGAAEVRKLALNTFWPIVQERADQLDISAGEGIDSRLLAAINRGLYATGAAAWAAGRTAAAADPAGFAHAYTITFDGDTHWLECDFCSTPVHPIDAGDSFEVLVTKARDHWRTCGAARVAENGADR